MHILVVEDEPVLRAGIVDLLEDAGYSVDAVEDGLTAVERGADEAVDLILLDVMLPRLDGVEACRRLRTVRPAVPILMLTARGSEDDKVRGLSSGADDYVTKPFGVKELLARIQSLSRRAAAAPADPDEIELDSIRLDLGKCRVVRDDGEDDIPLTPREVGVVRWLHRHRSRAVSRAELLEQVWGVRGDLQTRTVDMTVAKLRQKIEPDPSEPTVIRTVTGVGYIWGAGR